jgi:hypothetical protein
VTVGELIKKLEMLPLDYRVMVYNGEHLGYGPLEDDHISQVDKDEEILL